MGPILFSIYVDALGRNVPDAKFHFYADDTAMYCCGSTLAEALGYLQTSFNLVERQLIDLKLLLNVSKNGRKIPEPPSSVFSLSVVYGYASWRCCRYLEVLSTDVAAD